MDWVVTKTYVRIYWVIYKLLRMVSIPERSARWRAKLMTSCLNVQFCLWVLPLSELYAGKMIINSIYTFIYVSILILSSCFFLKYKYVDPAIAKLNEAEAELKYKGFLNYVFVVAIYLTAFGGFVFLVEYARKIHGS